MEYTLYTQKIQSYSKYLKESGRTIVDIDGFFWRVEIYPKNKIDLSLGENPRRHLEGVEIL